MYWKYLVNLKYLEQLIILAYYVISMIINAYQLVLSLRVTADQQNLAT